MSTHNICFRGEIRKISDIPYIWSYNVKTKQNFHTWKQEEGCRYTNHIYLCHACKSSPAYLIKRAEKRGLCILGLEASV